MDSVFLWSATPEGRDWWREVCDKLRAIAEVGTTDGKPWVEPGKPHSVDSAVAGFVMPDEWHGRRVDATSNGRGIIHNVRLVGWDAFGQDKQPYCIIDNYHWPLWVERIRFTD